MPKFRKIPLLSVFSRNLKSIHSSLLIVWEMNSISIIQVSYIPYDCWTEESWINFIVNDKFILGDPIVFDITSANFTVTLKSNVSTNCPLPKDKIGTVMPFSKSAKSSDGKSLQNLTLLLIASVLVVFMNK